MNMDYEYSCNMLRGNKNNEISAICWMPFLQALNSIRSYNLEKRKVLVINANIDVLWLEQLPAVDPVLITVISYFCGINCFV